MLLTEREKLRRYSKHVPIVEENRYINVKRSMASIKLVITERTNIEKVILQNSAVTAAAYGSTGANAAAAEQPVAPAVSRYSAIKISTKESKV